VSQTVVKQQTIVHCLQMLQATTQRPSSKIPKSSMSNNSVSTASASTQTNKRPHRIPFQPLLPELLINPPSCVFLPRPLRLPPTSSFICLIARDLSLHLATRLIVSETAQIWLPKLSISTAL